MSNSGWGVAFSGGGQRGFAHIGVIRGLEQFGLTPVAITGTSAGAIFGGFWACGKTAAEMEAWSKQLDTRKLLDVYFSLGHLAKIIIQWLTNRTLDFQLPPGIFRGEKFYREIKRFIGDVELSDIPLPLAIPAVDLDTGEEVIFSNRPELLLAEGIQTMPSNVKLADAIRASIAVPGVFAPWVVAGRRLVDGGLSDNIPVRRLHPLGASRRMIVDVGEPIPYTENASNSLPGIAERSVAILTRQLVRAKQESAEIVVAPQLPSVMIGDFSQNEVLVKSGYQAALKTLTDYFSNSSFRGTP